MQSGELSAAFAAADTELAVFERRISRGDPLPLAPAVEQAIALVRRLVTACIVDEGKKPAPEPAAVLLDVFEVLVKGEPSWTAIRDNRRELVYCRNCINMGREDVLPGVPEKMAVRTARHMYLYVKTRCIREGRLDD